jgi:hypothetical protein
VEFQSGSGIEDTMLTIGGSASAQRTTLTGFTIDCSNQATPTNNFVEDTDLGHGVFLDDSAGVGVQQSVVDGVRVLNASNEGIGAAGPSLSPTLHLRSTVRDCIVEGAGTRGIHAHNDHSLTTVDNWVIGGGDDADGNDVAIRHSHIMVGNTVVGGDWRYGLYGSDNQTIMMGNVVANCTLENEAVRTWTGGLGVDHLLYNHVYGVNSGAYRIRNRSRLESNAAWRCDGDSFIIGAPCQIDGFIAHEAGNRGVYVPGSGADGSTTKTGGITDPAGTNNNGLGMKNDGGGGRSSTKTSNSKRSTTAASQTKRFGSLTTPIRITRRSTPVTSAPKMRSRTSARTPALRTIRSTITSHRFRSRVRVSATGITTTGPTRGAEPVASASTTGRHGSTCGIFNNNKIYYFKNV